MQIWKNNNSKTIYCSFFCLCYIIYLWMQNLFFADLQTSFRNLFLTVFLRKFIRWYSATFFWASLQLSYFYHHLLSFQIAKAFQFVFDRYTMLILSHCKVFWYTKFNVSPTQNIGLKYYLIRKLRLLKTVQ